MTDDRASAGRPLLNLRGISKTYGTVRALDDVDISIRAGEVRALLGRNGAGKSTLVKIISGAERPDDGSIDFDGAERHFRSPAQAAEVGIGIVHQELSLVPGLTVAENIMLGTWPSRRRAGVRIIDSAAMERRAVQVLDRLGVSTSPRARVDTLSMAERQSVEIAKGLVRDPRLLILDEPTSSLAFEEVEIVLQMVRRLAAGGVAVIYVSHRMDEIPRVADTITVLRDGRLIDTIDVTSARMSDISALILGPQAVERVDSIALKPPRAGIPALELTGLNVPGRVDDVSLRVQPGEILGIAGLLGSGRSETLRGIFGVQPGAVGDVRIGGRMAGRRAPREMIAAGVALAPEDRGGEGLVLGLSVGENLVMSAPRKASTAGVRRQRQIGRLGARMVDRLAVKTRTLDVAVGSLSGGNQQKVVIGKCLMSDTKVLLLDEPTRGIDIEAKQKIYRVMAELAAEGMAVVFVSSELEELPGNAHRIVVLRQGRIVADFDGQTVTVHELLKTSMGDVS